MPPAGGEVAWILREIAPMPFPFRCPRGVSTPGIHPLTKRSRASTTHIRGRALPGGGGSGQTARGRRLLHHLSVGTRVHRTAARVHLLSRGASAAKCLRQPAREPPGARSTAPALRQRILRRAPRGARGHRGPGRRRRRRVEPRGNPAGHAPLRRHQLPRGDGGGLGGRKLPGRPLPPPSPPPL